jgi:hypothetical protein
MMLFVDAWFDLKCVDSCTCGKDGCTVDGSHRQLLRSIGVTLFLRALIKGRARYLYMSYPHDLVVLLEVPSAKFLLAGVCRFHSITVFTDWVYPTTCTS